MEKLDFNQVRREIDHEQTQKTQYQKAIPKETIMCTFDAPIARCETMHQMVLLDETRKECACEHGCPPGQICPLAADFARCSGLYEAHPEIGARGQPRVHATMH